MRTVAIEEHFSIPALAGRVDQATMYRRRYGRRTPPKGGQSPLALLPDLGEGRLKSMDESGITMQVLSNSGPGPELLPSADGIAMARELNDQLAAAVARHPDRYAGFAALAMQSPDDAAAELARTVKEFGFVGAMVNGTTDGKFLDHPSF